MKKILLSSAVAFSATLLASEVVKVSDFGYDPADSTEFIRQALASGAKKVILDRQAGPWYTLPLKMPSNIELELESGVELVAKRGEFRDRRSYLVEIPGSTNVTLRGGQGSTLRMWKHDYQNPPYEHSEWRYALRIAKKSENILVENLRFVQSGGDGIGVSGKNVTIRNCVCDDNHRQGMSVFSVENLLVENTVFSNTRGTNPQAGVDIEPDTAKERIVNAVFRNCVSYGNAGNGFEMFLINLTAKSDPVSVRFENCRSWGNGKDDATISCTAKPGREPVCGQVSYVNCVFGPSKRRCATFSNLKASAVNVTMEGCTLYNNLQEGARPAVVASVARPSLGVPDGFDFKNLTVYQSLAGNWFGCAGAGAGEGPKSIKGSVRVVDPNGDRLDIAIDDAWVKANVPIFDGGRELPPRGGFPEAAAVEVCDSCPGEMVATVPIALHSPAGVVFFADKPGPCKFVMRQVLDRTRKVRRPLSVKAVGGKKAKDAKLPAPDVTATEVVFNAPERGFYQMSMARWAARLVIEKSSVPLALDFSAQQRRVSVPGGKPFSVGVPFDGREYTLMMSSGISQPFSASVTDANGKTLESSEQDGGIFIAHGAEGEAKGLRKLSVRMPEGVANQVFTFDMYGPSPYVFITPGKYWK